jgi:ATP-dependent DNA helicase RecG
MTKTELLELIKNGESSGVEFKRDTIDNRAMAKELVAFANHFGGRVILGVDDDGSIAGLTRERLEEWVMTVCRDKIRPELIPFFEIIRDVEPGKDIAVVQVDRGWAVHHMWHNNHRTYYIRVGTLSREASAEELERLFQQRGAFRLEVRGVSGSSMVDFDYRRLRDYFERVRQQAVPPGEPLLGDIKKQWSTLLVNTEFLIEDVDCKPATVAGLLLFCANPNRFLPQAGIDAVAYPGNEKDYAAKERLSIRGPMTALFGTEGLVENGLVEQAIEFVKRNTGVTASLADGARREQKWTYPEEAVREAIVNALVHRDYLLSGTTVELSVYEDRLEVISPGRLPNGITPQRMLTGCRAARNQLLKDVMRDYGYLEHMGMGVPRKIVKEMQKHNGTAPDLIEDGELFTVRLWKK